MCDYSLHLVASRPAKVGDKLVATDFVKSITGGFARQRKREVHGAPAPRQHMPMPSSARNRKR